VTFQEKAREYTPKNESIKVFEESSTSTEPKDSEIIVTRRKEFRVLILYENLCHLSFSKLRLLTSANIIPKELTHVNPTVCPGCAYGKAYRRPIRYEGIKNGRKPKQAQYSVEVVSIDRLVSPTLGFVPIHRGNQTNKRYVETTIFVDHFSNYT